MIDLHKILKKILENALLSMMNQPLLSWHLHDFFSENFQTEMYYSSCDPVTHKVNRQMFDFRKHFALCLEEFKGKRICLFGKLLKDKLKKCRYKSCT